MHNLMYMFSKVREIKPATQLYMRPIVIKTSDSTNIASKCSDLTPIGPNPNN